MSGAAGKGAGGGVESRRSQLRGSAGSGTRSTCSRAEGEVGGLCGADWAGGGTRRKVEVLEGRSSGESAAVACKE